MDAATIEEANRMRAQMGLPLLPVPGAAPPSADSDEDSSGSEAEAGEEEASTVETRQAQAYDNYKEAQAAEAAKRKRDERVATAKKERDNAQRFAKLEGKGLGEAEESGDLDAKAWLKAQKKRQKLIDKNRKLEDEQAAAEREAAAALEYTSKDLAGVKVAHDMSNFLDGDEQVLTLKDTTINQNEEDGDELENLDVRAQETLKERLDLKKGKPAYDVHDLDESGERGILAQYDDEIHGKKTKRFTLDGSGAIAELSDILDGPAQKTNKLQSISLDMDQDAPKSDYMDASEIKVKKPKKKKSKSTRQKPVDEDDIFPEPKAMQDDGEMDVDSAVQPTQKKRKVVDDAFVDDEDLQASLAIQRRSALKKRKRTRPEDIAKQVKEQSEQPEDAPQDGDVVIDEISEFVSGLKKPEEAESRKPAKPKPSTQEASVTAMDDESDEEGDHVMHDQPREDSVKVEGEEPGLEGAALDEEKTVGTGMGSALALLRERGLVKDNHGKELSEHFRDRSDFLSELRRIEGEQDDKAKQQRERDRTDSRWNRMSVREREEWARQQNAQRDHQQSRALDALFREKYNPNVELKYSDEFGRSLNQKEAFKHLSHQFHGKTSGKGKTDKRLKKIENEKKHESQTILDSSQNASSQKRKDAGVRLQ